MESYGYDPVGNRLSMNRAGAGDPGYTWNYTYDAANQLTRMAKTDGNYADFQYDANGNRTAKLGHNYTTSYSYDYENRITRIDEHNGKAIEYAYDGDGNLVTKTNIQPNAHNIKGLEVAQYLYDLNNAGPESVDEDSPTAVNPEDADGTEPAVNTSLSRIESTVSLLNKRSGGADFALAPQLPANPLNDIVKPNLNKNMAQVIAVYNGKTGALDADYTYGMERLSVHNEDTTTGKVQDPLYYLYDGMGRVSELTNTAGHVSDKYRFDPFGVELPGGKMSPNAYKVLQNPFGYNGEMYDLDAQLSYMRNRFYEPETGRFMTRDLVPGHLSDPLTYNKYAYVNNNPLKYLDSLGLEKSLRYKATVNISLNISTDTIVYNDTTIALPDELYNGVRDKGLSNSTQILLAESTLEWFDATNEIDREAILSGIKAVRKYSADHQFLEGFNNIFQSGISNLMGGSILGDAISGDYKLQQVTGKIGKAKGMYLIGKVQYLAGNALNTGNLVHYDQLNGGTGDWLPKQLQEMYPETEFEFSRRGQKGVDVRIKSESKHPSRYKNNPMDWKPGNDIGDFKPGTEQGWKGFLKDISKGKIPANSEYLPYNPETGKLMEKTPEITKIPGAKPGPGIKFFY